MFVEILQIFYKKLDFKIFSQLLKENYIRENFNAVLSLMNKKMDVVPLLGKNKNKIIAAKINLDVVETFIQLITHNFILYSLKFIISKLFKYYLSFLFIIALINEKDLY